MGGIPAASPAVLCAARRSPVSTSSHLLLYLLASAVGGEPSIHPGCRYRCGYIPSLKL